MKFVSHRPPILKGLNSPIRQMSWNSHYRNGLSSHLIDIIRALHGTVVPDNSAALRSNPHRYRCMSKWFTPHQVFHPSCQLSTISSVTTACKITIPLTRLQLLKSGIPTFTHVILNEKNLTLLWAIEQLVRNSKVASFMFKFYVF